MAREIPLTRGMVAIVDDADFDWLSQWKWHVLVDGSGRPTYARRYERIAGVRTYIPMHRQIMSAPSGLEVDHRNRNRLDNRRENLRLCNRQQNSANVIGRPSRSGFRCVKRQYDRWTAEITVNARKIYLGTYDTPEEAARAYDVAARKFRGAFAILNFPEAA